MSYTRLYPQRINWEDEPSLATPINQVNLNKMDSALFGIDGRVVELDENKVGKNETFNTSRNGVVPKPTQADITNEKVLRADGVWVEQSGGGGGGGGHTIVNNAGTSLQQRGKLQTVGGLNASDDSENNTTKITDEYEIIPWTTWQGYSDAQKAEHPNAIVTGAPDCDGTLEIENLHLAWENPNPTSMFASQTIILDTDGDYDFLRVVFTVGSRVISVDSPKGYGGSCSFAGSSGSGSQNINYCREYNYVSDTSISFIDGYTQYSAANRSVDNSTMKPLYVYTYNKDLTAKIKAIAHDVSTDASKCMMSDDTTSVEDAINAKTETIVVPLNGTTDGIGNYYTGIDKTSIPPMGGVLFDTDSTSYDGLYIPFISPVTGGLYLHVTNFAQVSQVGVTVKGNLHITRRI